MSKLKNLPINSYLKIRGKLDTGDVICCESWSWFLGFVGHTAVVYRDHRTDTVYVWETTMGNYSWSGKRGVHLTRMGDWLKRYKGRVGVRRTEHRSSGNKLMANSKAQEYIRKNSKSSYPTPAKRKNRLMFLRAWIDPPVWLPRLRELFTVNSDILRQCGGEVTAFEQAIGLMRGGVPNEIIPWDYQYLKKAVTSLLVNCKLLELERLK